MVFGAVLRKSQCIMHISNVCRAASCPFLTGPFLRVVLPRGLWPLPGIDEALKQCGLISLLLVLPHTLTCDATKQDSLKADAWPR